MTLTINPADIVALDRHNLITPAVEDAVALVRGNHFMLPAPELAEPEHAAALVKFQRAIWAADYGPCKCGAPSEFKCSCGEFCQDCYFQHEQGHE